MSEHQEVREAEPLTLPEAQALGQDLLDELLDAVGDQEQTQATFDAWLDVLPRTTELLLVSASALVQLVGRIERQPDGTLRIEATDA